MRCSQQSGGCQGRWEVGGETRETDGGDQEEPDLEEHREMHRTADCYPAHPKLT